MPNRDQNRGFGGRGGERPRGYDPRRPGERDRPWEGRSFDERDRFNSDEARYGDSSRGRREAERRGEEWRSGAAYDPDGAGYGGGQEYGMEGGRGHEMRRDDLRGRGRRSDERETWSPDVGEPYGDLELNPRNRGVQEFGPPADYAYHPHAGHEFDSDYLHWRDEQMRSHDRDYREWRRSQQRRYDDDYRRYRAERASKKHER